MDNKIKNYILIFVVVSLTFIIIDYFNVPTLIGLNVSNINNNLLNTFINAIIVIILYLITYLAIDKRTIQKSNNRIEIYKHVLTNMYQECIDTIELFSQKQELNCIIKKIDFRTPLVDNNIFNNLVKLPFNNKEIILDLAQNGEIDLETFKKFLTIQREYRKYINMMIILFDRQEQVLPLKNNILNILKEAINELGGKNEVL